LELCFSSLFSFLGLPIPWISTSSGCYFLHHLPDLPRIDPLRCQHGMTIPDALCAGEDLGGFFRPGSKQ
jgi:hypothetical protein